MFSIAILIRDPGTSIAAGGSRVVHSGIGQQCQLETMDKSARRYRWRIIESVHRAAGGASPDTNDPPAWS
ncbi:hypothetical protein SC1_00764 [Sphingopyxis sp. C-1]|nr:hypothetical protein SC1_00764 [Sphingopyxis sp. C-1]